MLGYAVSAMIQTCVPRGRLAPYLGDPEARSVSLATAFGAASSSCPFAALSAARALILKGAHCSIEYTFYFNLGMAAILLAGSLLVRPALAVSA